MLLKKITKEELSFMEFWHTPIALAECLFPDFDNLGRFDEENLGSVRLYQKTMLSQEAIIDFDGTAKCNNLNKKQQFELRKNVADVYNLGARLYGKSLITLRIDITLSALYEDGLLSAFFSIDEKRLRGILDHVKRAFEYHPIFRMYDFDCKYKPAIIFYGEKNHWSLQGINMTLKGKSPGEQFYQLHVEKLWGDEVSFETEDVYKKRKYSVSELGCIFRFAGMTNFTRHSPTGRIFYAPENKGKIINYPRFVNPTFTLKDLEDDGKDFGGESSVSFRVFCKGEVVEDGVSEFDIERIKACYNYKKKIKRFELKKNQYKNFENLIVVERPKNTDRIFICADIGESAGTDIIINSEVGDKYNYLYNIVLYNFTDEEQYKVIKWLIQQLQANVVGIECGEGTGRAVYHRLEKVFTKENLVWYDGSKNINVGFEKDDNNKVIIKKGKPVYRKEGMKEWSVRRLKTLLYETRCRIPTDYKFEDQINSVISTKSGTRTIFACISQTGNHLFEAWRVFAIAQWLKKDFNETKPMRKKRGTGASSWTEDEVDSPTK